MFEDLSIIIPAYNEEKNIVFIYEKIKAVLEQYSYELIFIDDGSSDSTFDEITKIAKVDNRVKGISFSRNFGHQIALLAGIKKASKNLIVMMDADGQHPPELIPDLIQKSCDGFDIVNTRRLSTKGIGWFKRLSSRMYYRILNGLTDIRIEYASSDFRLLTRKAANAFLEMEEQNRFTRGMISWMGFKQAIIEYDAKERFAGNSKYTLRKMFRFATEGITSFSVKPLKISFYIGLIALFVGSLYAAYAIVVFLLGKTVMGWTSTLLTILFLGGIQLLGIGILGEYTAKIYNEIKKRPHYFIKDECGF